MKVYHGTLFEHAVDIINDGINLSKSKEFLDFGKGFYVTPDYDLAKDMAIKTAFKKRVPTMLAAVLTFEYTESPGLRYKIFESADINWACFILRNRVSKDTAKRLGIFSDTKYDIVIGDIADGQIAKKAYLLRNGLLDTADYTISINDFTKSSGNTYGQQITFCTNAALSCIKYVKCDTIKLGKE